MRRLKLIAFNLVLALVLAAAYTVVLLGGGVTEETIRLAVRASWWSGLIVGGAIAAGAALGPRPPLGWLKCIPIQLAVVVSSAIGAYIGSLFPEEMALAEATVQGALASRGIVIGSWIGAALGTVGQVIQTYRRRRRPDPET